MMKPEGSLGSVPSTMIKYDPSIGSYASSHYKKKIDAQWSSASSNDPFRLFIAGLFCYICILYFLRVDSFTYASGWSIYLCRL
jgi:hypothetical protein